MKQWTDAQKDREISAAPLPEVQADLREENKWMKD